MQVVRRPRKTPTSRVEKAPQMPGEHNQHTSDLKEVPMTTPETVPLTADNEQPHDERPLLTAPVTVPIAVDDEQPQNKPCPDSLSTGHVNHEQQSPRKLRQELNASKKKIASLQKKLKMSQQRNRRMGKKVTSLQEVVKQLKDNNLISSNCEEMLSQTFSTVPLALMKRMSTKKIRKRAQILTRNEVLCIDTAILFCQSVRVCEEDLQSCPSYSIPDQTMV